MREGLPGEAVQDALGELKTNGPLWQLKVNCLRYCRHVHAHHGAEDGLLFPALRAADPSIGPLVDRLEADHARVSDLLDVVEAAARMLTDTDGGDARQRVIDGLRELHVDLLEHDAPPGWPRGLMTGVEDDNVADSSGSSAPGAASMGRSVAAPDGV